MNLYLVKLFSPLLILTFVVSCSNPSNLSKIVDNYQSTHAQRADIVSLMGFYSDEIVLKDMINGEKIEGKPSLEIFFDWNNPAYKKLHSKTLIVEENLFEGNKVVSKGYFTPFKWGETEYEAMHFTTILTFNSSGKIIKQIDWINYPNNLVDYENRKNSNNWIK